ARDAALLEAREEIGHRLVHSVMAGRDPAINVQPREIPGSSPGMTIMGGSPLRRGLGRALQLDGVAVWVGDVDRRAVTFGAVAAADLARVDAVPLQMRGQSRHVHLLDLHR